MQSRPSLKKIKGANISEEVTDDVWEREFSTIDINKNGFISFAEFCTYVTKYIVTPQKYVQEIMEEKHSMYEEEKEESAELVEISEDNIAADASEASPDVVPAAETVSTQDLQNGAGTDTETIGNSALKTESVVNVTTVDSELDKTESATGSQ